MNAPVFTPLPNARSRPVREFRMQQIWDVVQRRAGLIVLTTLAVVLLAVIYVLQVRPQYAATSEIMLDPRKSSVENSAAVLSNLIADQPTILNQIEILTSHRFAGKVVDRFRLDRDPEFAAAGIAGMLFSSGMDPREIAIRKLRKTLSVAQAGFSSSIRITLTSADPQKAAAIASNIATMYVQQQLDTKTQASQQASRWLTQRVIELAQQVKDAEAAVQKYKADHRITINAVGTSVLEQQVADLNSQLTVARTEYDDKAAKAARTAELMKSGDIASAPQSVASPLISNLRTQQSELNREIANLATKYGPNHPKMTELIAQRRDLEAKIALETARIADSVRNDAETSRTHVESLQKGLRQIEDLNAHQNQDAVELTALQSAAASARAMYQAFLTQYSQTENQQGILRPDAYVISASEVNEVFGPQTKMLAIFSAFPAGLLLGLALAFMAESGSPPALKTAFGEPDSSLQPAAVVPEIGRGLRAADLVVTSPQSPFALAVSRLLSSVVAVSAPPATIVVTSMTPGAGKTTLTLALARAAAKAGIRTIAIDANRPQYHLGEMIERKVAMIWLGAVQGHADAFINSDPLSPALVMAADPRLPGYEGVVAPAVLARLVANFKSNLDLVIIAAPPLGDPFAASVLALGDMVLVAIDNRCPYHGLPTSIAQPVLTVFTHAQ